ncbi:glycosyl hydrolase [Aspergillus carlsbadensis]|nr:glycosyl hydrolase [Aspergillus carlsbadensis]
MPNPDPKTTTYTNPLIPAFNPDPSIIHHAESGFFYLITSTFHLFPGLPIYASRDLKSWTHIGNAINRPEQLSLDKAHMVAMPLDTGEKMVGAGGLFAPTLRFARGRFWVVCTNAVIGEGGEGKEGNDGEGEGEEGFHVRNFIIHTDDIWAGEWSDPVYVDFHGIDPSLFFDDDESGSGSASGKVYFQGCFFINRLTQPSCTIHQFEINPETGQKLSPEKEIWGGHARYDTEGPHIYKRGEVYYLLVAEGGTFEHHMLCIARSKSIWGPYEDYVEGNPILTADGTDEVVQNAGHGELVQDGEGGWWAVVLAVQDVNRRKELRGDFVAPLGRQTFLAQVEWPEGGWPRIEQPRLEFSVRAVDIVGKGDDKKIQASHALGNLFIRTPDLSKYQIPANGKAPIPMKPSVEGFSAFQGTCSFVGRRQGSLNSSCTASLNISSLSDGVHAGLALYKDNLRHVSLVYNAQDRKVRCSVTTLDGGKTLSEELQIDANEIEVQFRIVAYATGWDFFTNASGHGNWTKLGSVSAVDFCAREMTGPIFGLFARAERDEVVDEFVRFTAFETDH